MQLATPRAPVDSTLAVMPAATDILGTFPRSPVQGNTQLIPITSWPEMHDETRVTKVEFDLFWYESVTEGVAYFFRWLGQPRSTVLVVWNNQGPTHIECRTMGDVLVSPQDSAEIVAEVTSAFRAAGYWQHMAEH